MTIVEGMAVTTVTGEGREVKGQAGPGLKTPMTEDGSENQTLIDKEKNRIGGTVQFFFKDHQGL